MLFSGNKKFVLDILEGQKTAKVAGVQRSATLKIRKSRTNTNKKAQTTGKSAQTTGAAQAEASCTNNKEHQTAATQEKSTKAKAAQT